MMTDEIFQLLILYLKRNNKEIPTWNLQLGCVWPFTLFVYNMHLERGGVRYNIPCEDKTNSKKIGRLIQSSILWIHLGKAYSFTLHLQKRSPDSKKIII